MTDDDGPVGGVLGVNYRQVSIRFQVELNLSVAGCDVSGVVEEVGSECETDVKKGDKVFCICHCANKVCPLLGHVFSRGAEPHRVQQQLEDGAFAEFAMVKDGHLAQDSRG